MLLVVFVGRMKLCCEKIWIMLFHRSQYSKSSLVSLVVVVINIVFDHRHEFFTTTKSVAVVTFSLKDPPESFHWPIVYALSYSRHALCHSCFLQPGMESPVGVLEASIWVAKRSSSRISGYCLIESSEHQRIVITVTDHIWHDSSVIEIKDRTEIDFVLIFVLVIPFEFSDICKPFFIWLVCCELPVQDVFCYELRIIRPACASVVRILDRRLDVLSGSCNC